LIHHLKQANSFDIRTKSGTQCIVIIMMNHHRGAIYIAVKLPVVFRQQYGVT